MLREVGEQPRLRKTLPIPDLIVDGLPVPTVGLRTYRSHGQGPLG
jgi:hypothetical protein